MGDEARNFDRNLSHITSSLPTWDGASSSFRTFSSRFHMYFLSNSMWTQAHTDVILAMPAGADKITRIKVCGLLAFKGVAQERATVIGLGTDAFENSADLRRFWENHVTPMFSPAQESEVSQLEFYAYIQSRLQPIQEYSGIKQSLFSAAWPVEQQSFSLLRKEFIKGIYSREVRVQMIRAVLTTPEDLRNTSATIVAREREIILMNAGQGSNLDGLATSMVQWNKSVTAPHGHGHEAMDWESMQAMDPKKAGMKCHNCGKSGHFARDCYTKPQRAGSSAAGRGGGRQGPGSRPAQGGGARGKDERSDKEKAAICHGCGTKGHYQRNCRKKKQQPSGGKGRAPPRRPGVHGLEGEDGDEDVEYHQPEVGPDAHEPGGEPRVQQMYPHLPRHDPTMCGCHHCMPAGDVPPRGQVLFRPRAGNQPH